MADVIGIGAATGITIATVRTARNLFWAALGWRCWRGRESKKRKACRNQQALMTVRLTAFAKATAVRSRTLRMSH